MSFRLLLIFCISLLWSQKEHKLGAPLVATFGSENLYCSLQDQSPVLGQWHQLVDSAVEGAYKNIELAPEEYYCLEVAGSKVVAAKHFLFKSTIKPFFTTNLKGLVLTTLPTLSWEGDPWIKTWQVSLLTSTKTIWSAQTENRSVSLQNRNVIRETEWPGLLAGESYTIKVCSFYAQKADLAMCTEKQFLWRGEVAKAKVAFLEPQTLSSDEAITTIKWNRSEVAASYILRVKYQQKILWQKETIDTVLHQDLRGVLYPETAELDILMRDSIGELKLYAEKDFIISGAFSTLHLQASENSVLQKKLFAISSLSEGIRVETKDSVRLWNGTYEIVVDDQAIRIDLQKDTLIAFTASSQSTLRGHLKNNEGQLLSGQSLLLRSKWKEWETTSSVDGSFSFVVPPGLYTLKYGTKSLVVEALKDSVIALPPLRLEDTGIKFKGVVKSSNVALSGVSVILRNKQTGESKSALSNDLGEFSFVSSFGEYQIELYKEGFVGQSKVLWLEDTQRAAFALKTGGKTLRGRVFVRSYPTSDTSSHIQPMANVLVSAYSLTDTLKTFTDDLGYYSLSLAGNEAWSIYAEKGQANVLLSNVSLDRVLHIYIEQLPKVFGVLKTTEALGSLQGVLIDSTTGKVVSEAILDSVSAGVFTYSFEEVPLGVYRLFLSSPLAYPSVVPTVLVQKNIKYQRFIGIQSDTVSLVKDVQTRKLLLRHAGKDVNGSAQLLSPYNRTWKHTELLALPKVAWVHLVAYPKSNSVLPMEFYSIAAPDSGDIIFELPAFHSSSASHELLSPTSSLPLTLSLAGAVDSVHLFWRLNGESYQQRTLQVGSVITHSITGFKPSTISLDYYWKVYTPKGIASNEDNPYRSEITYSAPYVRLQYSAADTLFVPIGKKVSFKIEARDGKNNLLASVPSLVWGVGQGVASFSMDSSLLQMSLTAQTNGVLKAFILNQNDTLKLPFQVGDYKTHRLSVLASQKKVFPGGEIHLEAVAVDTVKKVSFLTDAAFQVVPTQAGKFKGSVFTVDSVYPGTMWFSVKQKQFQKSIKVQVQIPYNKGNKAEYTLDSNRTILLSDSLLKKQDFVLLEFIQDSLQASNLYSPEWSSAHLPLALELPEGGALHWSPEIKWNISEDKRVRLFQEDRQSIELFPEAPILARPFLSEPAWAEDSSTVWLTKAYPWFYLFEKKEVKPKISLDVTPNPFSPWILASKDGNEEIGTRIDFVVETPGLQSVLVDLEIYNMRGEKVRSFYSGELFEAGEYKVYWDGKTESQRMARNGRYILHFRTRLPGQSKTLLSKTKYVVVFK